VSGQVARQPRFQEYLAAEPLFSEFVRLAASEHQYPVPVIPGAALLKREIESVGELALSDDRANAAALLSEAERRVNEHLARQAGAQR
jgi:multiple sugar transport system substrate-binding protein